MPVSLIYCLCFFMYQNEVCLLLNAPRADMVYDHKKTISAVLEKITARLGTAYKASFRVSGPFDKISGLYFANEQCGLLLKTDAPQRSGSVVFFEDNISAAAFALLKERLPAEYITPSALKEIERYDAAHKSSLAQTLKAYLCCGKDLVKTAQTLGLHRNTIDKRKKKIRKLFDLNQDDTPSAAGLYMVMSLSGADRAEDQA